MGNVIDIILIVLVLLFTGLAYRKGFLKTILEVAASILGIFCAFKLAAPAALMVYNNFLKYNITKSIGDNLPTTTGVASYSAKAEAVVSSMPDFIFNIAKGTGVTKDTIAQKIGSAEYSSADTAAELADRLVKPIATSVLQAVIFLIAAIVLMFLFKFFAKLISTAFTKEKGISVNKILGAVFGAAKGVVIVYIFCSIVQIITYSASANNTPFATALSDSTIFAFMTEKNPIVEGLKNIF